jgi:hypothetical protein
MVKWKKHSRFSPPETEDRNAVTEYGIHSVFKTNPIRIGNRVVLSRLIPRFDQVLKIVKAGMIWIPCERKQGFHPRDASQYHLLEKNRIPFAHSSLEKSTSRPSFVKRLPPVL